MSSDVSGANYGRLDDGPDEKKVATPSKRVGCCELFRYATCFDWLLIVIGLTAAFAAGASQTLLMFSFGNVIDSLSSSNGATSISDLMRDSLFLLIYIAIGSGICFGLSYSMVPWVAVRQVTAMRLAFFRSVLRQDLEFFDTCKPGEMSGLINENVADIQAGLSKKLVELVFATSATISALTAAFYFSWEMSLVLLGFLPLLGASAACLFRFAGGELEEQRKEAYADADAIATEALSSMRTVQSFSGETALASKYEGQLGKAEGAAIRLSCKVAMAAAFLFTVMFTMYGSGFWYGGFLIANSRQDALAKYAALPEFLNATGEWEQQGLIAADVCGQYKDDAFASCACDIPFPETMPTPNCGCRFLSDGLLGNPVCVSTGTILIAFFCLITGGFSLGQLGPAVQAVGKARSMAYSLYAVIDRVPRIEEGIGKVLPTELHMPSFEFRDVHFSYRDANTGEVKRPVFQGLSFTIKAGETVAFVGESGSGKSTVGKLIARMYDVDSGQVLLDGEDIRGLDVSSLRSHVGLVSQEPLLFDKTIKENIALGLPDETVSIEQIKAAARQSNAHDFITSAQFPAQYNTVVGARGGKLSGGQKQRVALARGLLRSPSILILDEATSALDMTSERRVQEALALTADTRTTIVIAHRLSTVQSADRIIVLGEGENGMGGGTRIVEQGTHAELMEKQGTYFALVGQQSQTDEGEGEDDEEQTQEAVLAHEKRLSEHRRSISRKASSVGGEEVPEEEDQLLKKKEEAKEEVYKVSSKRVWGYARGKYCIVAVGALCSMVGGAVMPALGLVFSEMLNAFTNYDDANMRMQIMQWAIFFFGIAFVQFFVQTGQSYFFSISGETIVTRIRMTLFRATLRQDITFFDDPKNNSGRLLTLLGTDTQRVQLVTGQALGSLLNMFTTLAFGLGIAFWATWKLALALLAALPLLGFTQAASQKIMFAGEVDAMAKLSECAAVVEEAVGSMKEVKAFGLADTVHTVYAQKLERVAKPSRSTALVAGFTMGISQAIGFGFYAFAFWYGAKLIDAGEIEYKNLMKALFVLGFAAGGAGTAGSFAGDQTKAKVACSSIFQLIDRVPAIDTAPWTAEGDERVPGQAGVVAPEKFKGRLELKNINFHYPMRADAEVFDCVNLVVEPGQTVALVGPSGSGKSTVIQLLERFYDPFNGTEEVQVTVVDREGGRKSGGPEQQGERAKGEILLDGHALTSLDAKWLRSQVGLVGQEPKLFYGTIAENIAMGKAGATMKEIVAAAKSASAHDFIEAIGGYDTDVGAGGSKLSGGQKQRVAIARAIIKNPKILLLDEATSALDNESEKAVQASLDALLADKGSQRTTVIVAHRLSTIVNCDVIFVLESDWKHGRGSRVVEKGTHQELMRLNGKYSALRRAFEGKAE